MNDSIIKFLYKGTAYCAGISILFFIFARLIGADELYLSLSRYLIILAFGMIVSASEFIFMLKKINVFLRYLIHYLILSVAFFFVFLTIRQNSGDFSFSPAAVFASLAIFTCFYGIILAIVLLSKKYLEKSKKETARKRGEKPNYTPKFK